MLLLLFFQRFLWRSSGIKLESFFMDFKGVLSNNSKLIEEFNLKGENNSEFSRMRKAKHAKTKLIKKIYMNN